MGVANIIEDTFGYYQSDRYNAWWVTQPRNCVILIAGGAYVKVKVTCHVKKRGLSRRASINGSRVRWMIPDPFSVERGRPPVRPLLARSTTHNLGGAAEISRMTDISKSCRPLSPSLSKIIHHECHQSKIARPRPTVMHQWTRLQSPRRL